MVLLISFWRKNFPDDFDEILYDDIEFMVGPNKHNILDLLVLCFLVVASHSEAIAIKFGQNMYVCMSVC